MRTLRTENKDTGSVLLALDMLVESVKEQFEYLRKTDMPIHCGICELFGYCKIINHALICPWLTKPINREN